MYAGTKWTHVKQESQWIGQNSRVPQVPLERVPFGRVLIGCVQMDVFHWDVWLTEHQWMGQAYIPREEMMRWWSVVKSNMTESTMEKHAVDIWLHRKNAFSQGHLTAVEVSFDYSFVSYWSLVGSCPFGAHSFDHVPFKCIHPNGTHPISTTFNGLWLIFLTSPSSYFPQWFPKQYADHCCFYLARLTWAALSAEFYYLAFYYR